MMRTMKRDPIWYVLIVTFVSAILSSTTAIVLSRQQDANSNRQWCDVLTTLTEGYTASASTPPTQRGIKLAADLTELRHRFDCD